MLQDRIADADTSRMPVFEFRSAKLKSRMCVAVAAVLLTLPAGASGAVNWDTSGIATWTCSFEPASGMLEMRAADSAKPVGGGLPSGYEGDMPYQIVANSCVGAGGTRLADVREVRVIAPHTLLTFGISVTETLRYLGRPLRYSFVVPDDGQLRLGFGYPATSTSRTLVAPTLTTTASGVDYNGDGAQDVTVDTQTWDVAITAVGIGGTFDLRNVPADPNDIVDHYFGSRSPVTFYGPRTGPDIRYHSNNLRGNAPSAADRITTYGGDDTITSGAGDDIIDTGAGDDAVFAGAGADTIHLGPGNDWGYGVKDTPGIAGGAGRDRAWGGTGNDNLEGSWYSWGEAGRDIITGCCALADGGSGTDFIWFGMQGKRSIVRCGSGVDYLPVGLRDTRAVWTAALRRTGCEKPWRNYRNEESPFQMAWRPGGGDGYRRQVDCGRLGYVYVCDPREPLPAAYGKCVSRSQC